MRVYLALQDQPMPLASFGRGSHRGVGVPADESPSPWRARAGDAMLVDGRTSPGREIHLDVPIRAYTCLYVPCYISSLILYTKYKKARLK